MIILYGLTCFQYSFNIKNWEWIGLTAIGQALLIPVVSALKLMFDTAMDLYRADAFFNGINRNT